MKTVRLTPEQRAQWAQNPKILVNDEGDYQRPAEGNDPSSHVQQYRDWLKGRMVAQYKDTVRFVWPNGALAGIARPSPTSYAVSRPREDIPLVSPETCQCSGWSGRPEGKHHPICTHKDAWELHCLGKATRVIVDLETGNPLRPATLEECDAAGSNNLITIGDRQYAILDISVR